MYFKTINFLLSFLLINVVLLSQQNHHALLIGVGSYLDSNNWSQLSSVKDVDLLETTLSNHGFSSNNIHKITNKKATKSGILLAIEKLLLQKISTGDIVFFHFSGHGQQVKDDNGDEIDGLDEALVPYDSPLLYIKGVNEGQFLLRDDELGNALQKIRKKLGASGKLIVTIDACHSGTGTRGLRTSRGTNIILADSVYLNEIANKKEDNNTFSSKFLIKKNDLAPIITLFSSSPRQLSYEYIDNKNQYGLFTYALAKSIEELHSDATFLDLLEKIKLKVRAHTSQQTPQAEGQLNSLIFKNGFRNTPKYFKAIDIISSDLLVINGGGLQSISVGSKVAFYPAKTIDTSKIKPIGYGIIDEVSAFDSDVILETPISKEKILSSKIYITGYQFGDLKVKLQLGLYNKKLSNKFKSIIYSYPFISLVDTLPDLFLESPMGLTGQNRIDLYQNDDTKILSQKYNSNSDTIRLVKKIISSITSYIKANYLRTLEIKNKKYKSTLSLLLKDENGKFIPIKNQKLKVGEIVKLKIENKGSVGFYFTILDIQPDDKINKLYPNGRPIEDFYLKKGSSFTSSEFVIEDPIGIEVLKTITTKEPLEFDITRGGNKNNNNPLEVLLSIMLDKYNITRGETPNIPSQLGYIGSVIVEIEK